MWNTIPPPHGSKPDPHLVHVEHSTRTWNMSGRALEFISADQKPSLFNNIGTQCQLAKKGHKARSVWENFAAMRQRYSLLTTVDSTNKFSPGSTEPVDPPHLFILFKGNKGGSVHRALLDMQVPPWLHLQVQEVGSYREEDMIDALRILCPTLGNDTAESKVVMLDWFAAHRTPEVIEFIESRGYIVLFHGGGCTPFTQINDTHLHAMLARIMCSLENKVMHGKRVDMHMNNQGGVPTLTREDVVDVATHAWQQQDHRRIAIKGYTQTGPLLPMTGPILYEDVYKDLRDVWHQLDPAIGNQQMGQRIRDEAIAFVDAGWKTKWSEWQHAKRLIIDHDDEDDPTPEGLEMMPCHYEKPANDDDDDDDDADGLDDLDDYDDDNPPGDGGGAGPGGATRAGAPSSSSSHEMVPATSTTTHAVSTSPISGGLDIASARDIMIRHARDNHDDMLLRILLRQRDALNHEKKVASTEAAVLLHERGAAELADRMQKRRDNKVEKQQAAFDTAALETQKAEAIAKTTQGRLEILRMESEKHAAAAADKEADRVAKVAETWLQTNYPEKLHSELRKKLVKNDGEYKIIWLDLIESLAVNRHWFRHTFRIPHLWTTDRTLLVHHSETTIYNNPGKKHRVMCSAQFERYLKRVDCGQNGQKTKDAMKSLRTLLDQTVPLAARYIFKDSEELHRIFHLNDYVLDKAFVYCIIWVSKAMTEPFFKHGVHCWPPKAPSAAMQPALPSPSSTAVKRKHPAGS